MNEYFLHYVWYYNAFDNQTLTTIDGEPLQIVSKGTPHGNSGQDFFNARIQIGQELWIGNVEIHVNSSDWEKHQHHKDAAYNNTILHVVYNHDKEVFAQNGNRLETLELKSRIPIVQLQKFEALHQNLEQIPCTSHQPAVFHIQITTQLHKALVQRMKKKSDRILELSNDLKKDWHSVFYITVARYLGFKINTDAMEMLARITPNKLLAQNRDKILRMEALLFGQAGMLQANNKDEYFKKLKKEYAFLKKKYNLEPMLPQAWKFGRLRPANFPTLRIAQLAQIALHNEHLFSIMLEESDPKKMMEYFNISASEYWNTHFRFDLESAFSVKKLGKSGREGLVMNAVAPVLFAYAEYHNNEALKEKALDLLDHLPPEKNRITELYHSNGIKADTAYISQALLGQYYDFCEPRKCLDCAVGIKILKGL